MIIGYQVSETLRVDLDALAIVGAGPHTITLWLVHYGSRSGSVSTTSVRATNYRVKVSAKEQSVVTHITNATLNTSGTPGGGWTPPPGGIQP